MGKHQSMTGEGLQEVPPSLECLELEEPPFDSLASAYDTWFEEEGKLIFAIEAQALGQLLSLLPRPWG